MSSSSTPLKEDAGSGCRIAEIVQYTCGLEINGEGKPQLHCFPIPRLFRMHVCHSVCSSAVSQVFQVSWAAFGGDYHID